MFMKRTTTALAVLSAGLLLGFATSPAAALTNPSFETGFQGYQRHGQGNVRNPRPAALIQPTDGNKLIHLTTRHMGPNATGQRAAQRLENFLGVSIADSFGGSAIMQTFTVTEESTLSFDFAMGEHKRFASPGNDIAFAVLNGQLFILGDLDSAVFTRDNKNFNFTDFETFTGLPTLQAGTHTLAIGVANIGDARGRSMLLLDNLVLSAVNQLASGGTNNGGTTAVPEPLTAGLMMMSLGAATLAIRRRRHAA